MDQNPPPPLPTHSSASSHAAAAAGNSGFVGASSSASLLRGSTSLPILNHSSSSAHSQRGRSSPSLYPPPVPRLASRGSVSGAGSSSSQQIPPARRGGRPVSPSPASSFFSELSSIRMTGASLSSRLETPQAAALHAAVPLRSRRFSGHPQSSSPATCSGLPPLPRRSFSGHTLPPQQQVARPPSPSTTYSSLPLQPGRSFSGLALPPSSTRSGNGSFSSFTQPAQPSSDAEEYELPPLPPSLQIPLLLPVKQEPVDGGSSFETELIVLDDDNDLPDGIPLLESSFTDKLLLGGSSGSLLRGWGAGESSGQSWAMMPELGTSNYNMLPCNFQSSMSMSQQQAPWPGSTLSTWSSDLPPQSDTFPGFGQSSSSELPPLPPSLEMPPDRLPLGGGNRQSMWNTLGGSGSSGQSWLATPVDYNMMSTGGGSSSGFGSMPWNCRGLTMGTSISMMPKLMLGGMESPRLPPPLPPPRAGATSGLFGRSTEGEFFTETEMETIMKDKRLKELVNTDPKRVKRILSNRISVGKAKARKADRILGLERQVGALRINYMSLSSQVELEQVRHADLKAQNNDMRMRLQGLEEQANMKKALNETLRAEIESLKLVELNMMYGNGLQNLVNPANSLHNLMGSQVNDASGPHQHQTQDQPPSLQQEQQPQQADDEFMDEQQRSWNF